MTQEKLGGIPKEKIVVRKDTYRSLLVQWHKWNLRKLDPNSFCRDFGYVFKNELTKVSLKGSKD